MLNWVDILRRVLTVYRVRTQAELGMALGVQLRVGLEDASDIIPWPVLEKVVAEKGVSWDWLLTGKGEAPAGYREAATEEVPEPRKPTPQRSVDTARVRASDRPLRIETRELARELLGREDTCPPPPGNEQ